MTEHLKNIESAINALTAGHVPELSAVYIDAGGQKRSSRDNNTHDLVLFTEQSAETVYAFMRQTIGKNPLVIG